MVKFLLVVMHGFQHCFFSHYFFLFLIFKKNYWDIFILWLVYLHLQTEKPVHIPKCSVTLPIFKMIKNRTQCIRCFFSMRQLLINNCPLSAITNMSVPHLSQSQKWKLNLRVLLELLGSGLLCTKIKVSKMYISLFLLPHLLNVGTSSPKSAMSSEATLLSQHFDNNCLSSSSCSSISIARLLSELALIHTLIPARYQISYGKGDRN